MVIIFNPQKPNGADISDFILEGTGKFRPHPAGEMLQYSETQAEALIENYPFLSRVSAEEAKQIIANRSKPLKCDFPGCDFSTTAEIALSGHKRTHKSATSETAIDPTIVPIAGSDPVRANRKMGEGRSDQWDGSISNGRDGDGVEWYGEGLQQDTTMVIRRPGDKGVFGA